MTRFSYGLPDAARVSIRVYDISGRLVAQLVDGELEAGHHITVWDAKDISAGVYIVRLTTPGFISVQKAVFVK